MEQGAFRESPVGLLQIEIDHPGQSAGNDPCDGIDVGGEKDIGEDFCEGGGEFDGIDNPVEPRDEAEGNRNPLQSVDEDIGQCGLVRSVLLDIAVDEPVQQDADGQGSGEDADGNGQNVQVIGPIYIGQIDIRQGNPFFLCVI